MIYYVVKVMYPDSSEASLIFALNTGTNLHEQVCQKVPAGTIIKDIQILGTKWPGQGGASTTDEADPTELPPIYD